MSKCAACGLPGHRYGRNEGMECFDPMACINQLRGRLEALTETGGRDAEYMTELDNLAAVMGTVPAIREATGTIVADSVSAALLGYSDFLRELLADYLTDRTCDKCNGSGYFLGHGHVPGKSDFAGREHSCDEAGCPYPCGFCRGGVLRVGEMLSSPEVSDDAPF